MTTKFSYTEYGLRVDASDGDQLSEQEAMIVAVNTLAQNMGMLAQAMANISEEFGIKEFYDRDLSRGPVTKAKRRSELRTPRL